MAADVYAAPPTPAAATGGADRLYIEPCLPEHWTGFKVHYRFRETVYHIVVTQKHDGVNRVTVDGVEQQREGEGIALVDDQREHEVEVIVSTT